MSGDGQGLSEAQREHGQRTDGSHPGMYGQEPSPPARLTVDGTGLLCVTLLLRLRKAIEGVEAGTVVHVIATDPAAPLDLPAWCHMTGHEYLGPVPGERPTYALRLARDACPTRPDRPWHRAGN
ncbi:sulfurtransferase TusA family protein [Streptomyces sp. NPDC052042]|uniref:sulfurtransferase TusA family protein n=1 Tax=Streptomyces sp. NPDC052042 TaxID=3365683 RepID=UPI0037D04EAB